MRLDIDSADSLYFVQCEAAGCFLKKSVVPPEHAGQEVFAGRSIGSR